MKYLESNTMWLPNKVYIGRMPKIIDEESAGSVGPGKGRGSHEVHRQRRPLGARKREPSFRGRGKMQIKSPAGSHLERTRELDSCHSPIGVVGYLN